jgi:hypothetical protein
MFFFLTYPSPAGVSLVGRPGNILCVARFRKSFEPISLLFSRLIFEFNSALFLQFKFQEIYKSVLSKKILVGKPRK